MNRKRAFLDAFVATLILLSVLMVFVEEGALAAGAGWPLRRLLALVAALFDLAFTVEFAVLLSKAFAEGRAKTWFFHESGWLDAIAALPLLVFVSGPFLFGVATGDFPAAPISGTLGGARLIRSLRVLRSLRLLRLIRLAPPDFFASKSAGANVSRAAFLALCAAVAAPLLFDAAAVFGLAPDARAAFAEHRRATMAALEASGEATPAASSGADAAEAAARIDQELLLVRKGGQVLYTRHSAARFKALYGPDAIGLIEGREGLEAYFDLNAENRALAVSSLSAACTALAVLLVVLFGFGRYFSAGVSQPLGSALSALRGEGRGLAVPTEGREEEEPFLIQREAERLALEGDRRFGFDRDPIGETKEAAAAPASAPLSSAISPPSAAPSSEDPPPRAFPKPAAPRIEAFPPDPPQRELREAGRPMETAPAGPEEIEGLLRPAPGEEREV